MAPCSEDCPCNTPDRDKITGEGDDIFDPVDEDIFAEPSDAPCANPYYDESEEELTLADVSDVVSITIAIDGHIRVGYQIATDKRLIVDFNAQNEYNEKVNAGLIKSYNSLAQLVEPIVESIVDEHLATADEVSEALIQRDIERG